MDKQSSRRWQKTKLLEEMLVQEISTPGPFNSCQLTWVKDIAYIKTNGLADFVEGEGKRYKEELTNFIKRSSSKKTNSKWYVDIIH
jgi:hypothetical protein